jgi:uncharacterized membrane protein YccF (DUF307 family)
MDDLRRHLDGHRLADRRRDHGDHHCGHPLGAGSLQHCVSRAEYLGTSDVGTGALGFIGNLIWLVLAGWWLALGHLITAIGLAITLIGIPFAWAHLKLAGIALWPIGKMIVDADDPRLRYQRP